MLEKNEQRARTGLEVGTAITVLIFLVGLSFQAGTQYEDTQNLKLTVQENRVKMNQMQIESLPINERLARVETILQNIRDELQSERRK